MDLVKLAVATTGSDGSATGSATSVMVSGVIYAIYLDYHASAPATTDVTLRMAGTPYESILSISNSNSDGWYYPRRQVCGADGTGLTYDGTHAVAEPFVVHDRLTLSVAGCNALSPAVTAYIYVKRC